MSALVDSPTQTRRWIPGILVRAVRIAFAFTFLLVLAAFAASPAQAQNYPVTVLYTFSGETDGGTPYAGLVRDAQGNLYGTTGGGGTLGVGTVFKLDTTGKETALYGFTRTGGDGALPVAGVAEDGQGNLYGTTPAGGTYGYGIVFKVDTNGNETVLHSFTGLNYDGIQPAAGLVLDAPGNLYGTTYWGGVRTQCGGSGCGTVFKVDVAGNETVLYTFTGVYGDGAGPIASLVLDAQGNFYGTTSGGGNSGCNYGFPSSSGCGTVFKLDLTGKETVLYAFTGGDDGGGPAAGLTLDAQGNLYGTTEYGGSANSGTVFKLDTTGKETVLHSFTGAGDGAAPVASLVLDAQGNLYGTTSFGGDLACAYYGQPGCGTVFKVSVTGKETVLHRFTGTGGDGGNPFAGLVFDTQGNLYGTTAYGGLSGGAVAAGTVFKLTLSETATLLTASPNLWLYGSVVNFTAAVSSPMGGTPTGKVTFYDGSTAMATVTLNGSGVANYSTSALPLGNNSITAVYGGDSNYGGSTSVPLNQPVMEATTNTLSSSPNPSVYGQTVTLITVINSTIGAPPNGEAINLFKGKSILGVADLSGGTAIFTTTKLKAGKNLISALYNGDATFLGSTSNLVSQVVSKATTTTTLASSLDPSSSGQSVTFTASVTPQFSGTVTGKISFYDGTTLLKTASMTKGTAKLTTSTLAVGSHTITATYNGDGDFVGSSAALTQTVN
jgi:uncharacterized repeat protein (TIGR03803 family)